MKYFILLITILSSLSFNGTPPTSDAATTKSPIDQQLNYRRIRALQDNTRLQSKLNYLINNFQ